MASCALLPFVHIQARRILSCGARVRPPLGVIRLAFVGVPGIPWFDGIGSRNGQVRARPTSPLPLVEASGTGTSTCQFLQRGLVQFSKKRVFLGGGEL